ncbi:MAG: FAD-dependent oxidoreductase, partial [Vicinamibacterales bacterium]
AFEREHIELWLGADISRVSCHDGDIEVHFSRMGQPYHVMGDALLVATGRTPNLDTLSLAAAGVKADRDGVTVDDHLRTTNRRVYAAGDICSRFKFTHAADAMARIVLRNALFFGRKRVSRLIIPWCTYTDPEVAHVGIDEWEATLRRPAVASFTVAMADVDRPVLNGKTEGFAQVHADSRSGRILGATIVSEHAGEAIAEMSLAMTAGLTLATLAKTVHPYPTQSEVWKKLADAWNRTRLTPRRQQLLKMVLRWRR